MRWVLAIAFLTVLALAGCGGASDTQATKLASQYGLHLNGGAATHMETLPAALSSLPWAQEQHACRGAGFDLKPYRGKKVTLVLYPLEEKLHGSPATFVTVAYDGSIVGAFVTVQAEAGGVYSLKQAKAEL